MVQDFHGAKSAVFIGSDLLIYQRDYGVVWPGYWDFPGGARDGDETPRACLKREVFEEFALEIPDTAITWEHPVPAMMDPDKTAWFFAVSLPKAARHQIRFGDEGRTWALAGVNDVANMPNLVPPLRIRLSLWLQAKGGAPI